MRHLRSALTFSNVIAVIALFVALGGSVYAAGKLSGKKIKPNSIPASRLKTGAAASNLAVTVQQKNAPTIAAGGVGGTTANCPAGQKGVAGGGLSDPATNGSFIEDSRPVTGATTAPNTGGTFDGWRVIWKNGAATPVNPVVWVVCLG